jgi:hypothetical protein
MCQSQCTCDVVFVKVGKQQMSITNLHKQKSPSQKNSRQKFKNLKNLSRQKFLGKHNVSYPAFFFCCHLLDDFLISFLSSFSF